jgi:hypothetical protein
MASLSASVFESTIDGRKGEVVHYTMQCATIDAQHTLRWWTVKKR